MNTIDAFVVMRFAEMLEQGSLAAILDNATSDADSLNFGGQALLRQVDTLRRALCEPNELMLAAQDYKSGTNDTERA